MIQQHKHLNYQIIGEDSSSKLVFLHGIMGQGRNWLSIAKKFSNRCQCLIYDQRGHGRSYHPTQGFDLTDYVEDLGQLLDEVGWTSKIKLIGHSMGGRVALKFAHRFQEHVEKLIIVDIGPTSDWNSMASILAKLDFVPTPFRDRSEARAFMENEFMAQYQNSMLMEFFYSNLTQRSHGYDWVFSPETIRQTLERSRYKDYWQEFKELSMPSLLIRGTESEDLKPADFMKVIENNPNLAGIEVDGAGHWVHAEKPRETIKIIEDFFNIAGSKKQC